MSITAHPDHHQACSVFGQVCTILLQSQQHYCVQDAVTFSRLLAVSKQLQDVLLHAARGCIAAHVPFGSSSASTDRCLVQWLCKHWGNLRCLQLDADDFFPDLYVRVVEALAVQAGCSSAASLALPQQHARGAAAGVEERIVPPAPIALELSCSCPPAAAVSASAQSRTGSSCPGRPSIYISWQVCGLLPAALPMLPGASLTHLTLRGSTLSPAAVQSLALMDTLRQLHRPNLNPSFGSLAPALTALSALTRLFIQHPFLPEQQALPVSLQHLTVAQQTPPWEDEGPRDLEPLQISHLTALSSLTIHEVVPRGVTEQYVLPPSLQHLAVVCITSARPLLGLKQLRQLRVSSLKHCSPAVLLQLSSLPALTALRAGCAEEFATSGSSVRLTHADFRAYSRVFARVPVHITALTVQEDAEEAAHLGAEHGFRPVLRALCCLQGLRSLSLAGLPHASKACQRRQHPQPPGCGGVTAAELAAAFTTALTGLTHLRLSHVRLAWPEGPSEAAVHGSGAGTASGCRSSSSQTGSPVSAADAAAAVAESSGQRLALLRQGKQPSAVACSPAASELPPWEQEWWVVLSALVNMPALRKLTCRGLLLGCAASALLEAVQLQTLELCDCGVPSAVVASLIALLSSNECRTSFAGNSSRGGDGSGGGGVEGGSLTTLLFSQP